MSELTPVFAPSLPTNSEDMTAAKVVDWLRNHKPLISVGVRKEADVLDIAYDYLKGILVIEVDSPVRH